MKYKDNNFIRHQEKQRDFVELDTKGLRRQRRDYEKKIRRFYTNTLSKLNIDFYWWFFLPEKSKNSVMASYEAQKFSKRQGQWWSNWTMYKIFDSNEEWRNHILSEYETDIVAYREFKLKRLGV
jgi:hypothetical protein